MVSLRVAPTKNNEFNFRHPFEQTSARHVPRRGPHRVRRSRCGLFDLVVAAFNYRSADAKGLPGALQALAHEPHGAVEDDGTRLGRLWRPRADRIGISANR